MFKKVLRIFVMVLALMAMIPNQIFAQNQGKIECYNSDCVFSMLLKLNSSDRQVVAEAEQSITELIEYYRYTGDSRVGDALKNTIIPFIEKFPNCNSNQFLFSQFPKLYVRYDIEDISRLVDNEQLADCILRAIGEIKGSGDFIMKYIDRNRDNLKYKAALAYGIGKQHVKAKEDELVSWIKGADERTKVDIYNALWVIKSNDNTTKIVEKGAKKLCKSKNNEYKISGMRLLAAIEGEKAMPTLYKALKSKDRDVRRAALELIKPYVNQEVVKNVVKKCCKGDAVVDAIDWLGDIKNDSQMEFVIKNLTSDNPKVVKAAIRAIFKIDNKDGINAVKPLFGGEYQDVMRESILAYEGDYRVLMNSFLRSDDKQKLAALRILEERPHVGLSERVQDLINSNNQEIRDLAYKVLRLVTAPAQAEYLKLLLERCDDKYVEDVQLAIKNAMSTVPTDVKDNFASTLKHVSSDLMPRYYKVFAYFGTELCIEKLIDAYQNGDYKFEAKEALLLVENNAYKDRIEEILNK